MTFDLTLKRQAEVHCYELVATISRYEKIEHIMVVLQWASEQTKSGRGLSPESLADHILGRCQGSLSIARRLLHICYVLGLIDEERRLTEEGNRAIETGTVPKPQERTWRLWACDDPLLPFPIIAISDSTNDHRDETDTGKQAEALPAWIRHAEGAHATMLLDGDPVRFDSISNPARKRSGTDRLTLEWTPGGNNTVHAYGQLDGAERIDAHVPNEALPPREKVWMELLRSCRLHRAWDRKREALCIPFGDTKDEEERLHMRRSIRFKRPAIAGLDEFNSTKATNITLRPQSAKDASQWAQYQLKAEIQEIQTARVFQNLSQSVRNRFKDWKIDLPDREQIAAELAQTRHNGRPTRSYWAVRAPLDWRL